MDYVLLSALGALALAIMLCITVIRKTVRDTERDAQRLDLALGGYGAGTA
jgi:hypothetical protein